MEYLSLFDLLGNYRGVLECSQDITDFLDLKGERRLAEWK